jgi:hypothetical protein
VTFELNDLIVFDVEPDWSSGVVETLSWSTNVLQAYEPAEQRIRLRGEPRTKLSFDMAAVDLTEFQYLRNLLQGRQAFVFAVPLWPDAVELAADLTPGDMKILCDISYERFRVLRGVIIFQGTRDVELRRVSDFDVDGLLLSSPIQTARAAEDHIWIVPALIGRLDDSIPYTAAAAVTQKSKLDFICEPLTLLEDGS